MNARDRATRFVLQWEINIYPNPPHWNLGREGNFQPDRKSLSQAVIAICKGALRITVCGEYTRHPNDNDPNHTPSSRAEATLDWVNAKWGGDWEIISIDTEREGGKAR